LLGGKPPSDAILSPKGEEALISKPECPIPASAIEYGP
jgi:hypothetical protein